MRPMSIHTHTPETDPEDAAAPLDDARHYEWDDAPDALRRLAAARFPAIHGLHPEADDERDDNYRPRFRR